VVGKKRRSTAAILSSSEDGLTLFGYSIGILSTILLAELINLLPTVL